MWLNPASLSPHRHPSLWTTYLLRNLACTLYQLLLGVGIAGAALQGSSLGDQGSAAMTQLLHPALDVGADLERNERVSQQGTKPRIRETRWETLASPSQLLSLNPPTQEGQKTNKALIHTFPHHVVGEV